MELREVFQIIKRKLWLIILIVVVVVGLTTFFSLTKKVSYETSSILTIQANREKTDQYQYNGYYSIQACDFFINTITGWVKSPILISKVYEKSGGGSIYTAKIPSQNLVLTASGTTPEQSLSVLEETIKLIRDKNAELNASDASTTGFEIISSDPITNPTKTNTPFNIVVSFIVAIIVSLVFVFFLEYLSPTINNLQRVRGIFKKVPFSLRGIKLKGLANQESKLAERFRFIRSNIVSEDGKEFLIVSGIGEKVNASIVSANLALSFARSGKKTILVDANFANPSIHEYFGKVNEAGFSELLFDESNPGKYMQKTDETNLKIISSGIKLAYASDTIERADFKKVANELKKEADVIIINTPALGASSEALSLFSVIKRALFVVRLGKTNLTVANQINGFADKNEVEKNIVIL